MTAKREQRALVLAIFVTALAGIVYELLFGTLSSLLLGDSILEWSLTIGVFLSAMGLGSWLSRFVRSGLVGWLVGVQVALAMVGGAAPVGLFAVYGFAEPALRGALVTVLVALGTGIGLEIPLLTRLMKEHGSLRESLASALAVDYVGALAASLAFPLLLYPLLGLVRTALVAALLNLGAAALLIAVFGERTGRRRLASGVVLGVVVLAAVAFAAAGHVGRVLDRLVYHGEVVWSETTAHQRIVVTHAAARDELRLYLNGNLQLSSRDERRYHEALVHPAMGVAARRARVLILGGGDGLAAREVLRHEGVERVVVVDLDPGMTSLARTLTPLRRLNGGSFSDPRVRLVHDDAMRWVERARGERPFDVVLVDLPDPSTPGLARLYSTQFFRGVERRLAEGGAIATQATSPYYTREAFWCIESTVGSAGLATRAYHLGIPSFGEWGFVLGARALPPRIPEPPIATRFMHGPAYAAMFEFAPDMARVEVEPSSVFEPVLPGYYAEAVRREQ